MTASAADILLHDGARTTDTLRRAIERRAGVTPAKLREALDYVLLSGGKRLRPTLVLESFAACGGAADREVSALSAAAAIEMIHTFSLVHDDLPAMDDDDLRRGRPTCHIVFGEAMAILAGDALVTMAFETIATDADAAIVAPLVVELSAAAGPVGMIGGQVLDIAGENQKLDLAGLQQIHRLKTGALIVAACRMGAIAAGASTTPLAAVDDFGRHIGLAFQIVDDLLDVTATPQQMGKATGKDKHRGKNTYPELMGVDAARIEAQRQIDLALAALSAFDASAEPLRTLARFVIHRAS